MQILDQGGFGIVYTCFNEENKKFAVKIMII